MSYILKTRKSKIELQCEVCGKLFLRHICNNIGKHIYCSKKCYNNCIRKSNKIIVSCFWCNNLISLWPYRLKTSDRHFCSRRCHGKWRSENLYAEKGCNWRGGNYSTIANILCNSRYRRIRKVVLFLDNNECQICKKNDRLEVHHIIEKCKNINLLYDVTNMITLCKKCHCSIRGKEEMFVGYFSDIIAKRVNSGNSRTDNPEPSRTIANRRTEGAETRAEETIMPISALHESDDIVQAR